jgi:hypothetical protein
MKMMNIAIAVLLLIVPAQAFAQSTATPVVPGYLSTTGCPTGYTSCFVAYGPSGSGGTPTPIVPGQLTFLGQQKISAAALASSSALTVPTGAIIADFYPECTTNGTDGQCVRFNPGGATDASAGSGLGSQQLLLGYSGGLASIQFILAAGATGAAGTIPTLTINFYK